jgi:hypothetical protein
MAVSSAAQLAELNAFKKVRAKFGNPIPFAEPAGFETSFPDFGFRFEIENKIIDVHIEYKADSKAQMGSMRDWIFDGTKYSTPDSGNSAKQDLIAIMNSSPEATANGKRLLNDLKKYFDPKVTKIYSGTLTIESEQASQVC